MAGGKNPVLTVCQLRTALSALVQSWWLTPKATERLLERTAKKIRYQQAQNTKARISHRKQTINRLHELGFLLTRLPQCRWSRR